MLGKFDILFTNTFILKESVTTREKKWYLNMLDRLVHYILHNSFQTSLLQSLIVLSFSKAAEAIIFSVGWHAVHKTTSVWPCNFWTTSFVCKFQIYTMLSSDPETIHLPPVTEKLAKIQYFSFLCPVKFKWLTVTFWYLFEIDNDKVWPIQKTDLISKFSEN